ncbi:MAG: arginase family protein [Nanoarchaeota archaeon]|nr:arginase family protein [Nanoarchaeota archaeon]
MAIDLPEWKLYSLEMDKGGEEIGEHFESQGYPIERVNPGEKIEGIERFIPNVYQSIDKGIVAKAVEDSVKTNSRVLALYGHGGYHFFTYGLAMLANRLSDEFGYIHIDYHHDTWFDSHNLISCGAFVRQICWDTNVQGYARNMLYIGNDVVGCSGFSGAGEVGIPCLRENQLELEFHEKMPQEVYVTIDLDVMHSEEVRTAFERESLRLNELKDILRKIKQKKRIISADICGFTETNKPYTNRAYILEQGVPAFKQSMMVYRTLTDIIMGG